MVFQGTGTGLTATYFAGTTNLDSSKAVLTRVDPTLNFKWGNGGPSSAVGSDNFSASWTGQVQAQTSERYTFSFNADDGDRLWINGQQIVNDWSDHSARPALGTINLVAGQKYDIRAEYYDRGGDASAQLSWQTPTISKRLVPTSQLYASAGSGAGGSTPTPSSGLAVQYFNSTNLNPSTLVASAVVPNINFDWGGGSPDPAVHNDNFSARYTGSFNVSTPGNYTFASVSDDGTRLWIDGQQLVNDWNGHAVERHEGNIALSAGTHIIKLEYLEQGGNASLRLEGSGPGFGNQVLPASLFTTTTTPPVTPPNPHPTGGSSSSGPSDLYAFHDSEMNVPNDAHPDGVPNYYSWYNSAAAQPGWGNTPPLDWHSVTAWGQVYESEGHHPEESPNTRVQLRNDELWWLSKSTKRWTELQAPGVQGGAFNSDFSGNGGTGVTTKNESANGGGISVTAGNGFNYHFWPGARAVINPSDIAGIYTRFQSRLVLDNANGSDDRARSHYIASGGADYWRSTDADFKSDFSNNGGVGGGRFKVVTNDWTTYSFSTLSADALASNAPPLTVNN